MVKKQINEYYNNYNANIESDLFASPTNINEIHALGVVYELLNGEKICQGTPFSCTKLPLQLRISYYKLISPWIYLNKTSEFVYDINGGLPVEIVTNYHYENSTHAQLTKKVVNDSKGNSIIQKTLFPQEMINLNILVSEMTQLINANRITEPILVINEIIRGGNTIDVSQTFTKYSSNTNTSNLLLPTEIHNIIGSNLQFPVGENTCKIKYTKYDSKGNICEYILPNGSPVSLIWGYFGQSLIAKIEGVSYNSIPSGLINYLQLLSNNDLDNCGNSGNCNEKILRDALLGLYSNSALLTGFITAYTHDPLTGITSMIDPRQITTFYEYDQQNQLKFIMDKNNKIIQSFDYNYKQ